PGIEHEMRPQPRYAREEYQAAGKLRNKVALITGGDSGIGRSVAVHFAKEGADVVITHLGDREKADAEETKAYVEQLGRKCFVRAGDLGEEEVCNSAVQEAVDQFGRIDILVNNAAEQH